MSLGNVALTAVRGKLLDLTPSCSSAPVPVLTSKTEQKFENGRRTSFEIVLGKGTGLMPGD